MFPIQSVLVAFVLVTGHALTNDEDLLGKALNVSYGHDYGALYNEAEIHLDMENVTTVSSKLESTENLTIYSSSQNCSSIMQVEGIPWNDDNSAMKINDNQSYVEINRSFALLDSLSVSMWIKSHRKEGNATGSECTVLSIAANDREKVKLKRKDNGHSYSLHVGEDDGFKANFSFEQTWEWNMVSFTIQNDGQNITIVPYENGANITETKGITETKVTADDFLFNGNVVTMRLNGEPNGNQNEGCEEVEVDEVAVWNRVLVMSEFIALRVQPFDTNCTVNVTILVDKIKDGTAEEAAAAVTEVVIVVNSMEDDDFTTDLVEDMDNALDAMAERNLLSSKELDSETRKGNREAFVYLTGAILDAADKSEDISEAVQGKNVLKRTEKVMSGVYFSEDYQGGNETISTEVITMGYLKLFQEPNSDSGWTIEDDSVNFTIPKSITGGESPKVIVTIYSKTVSDFLASTVGDVPLADRMVSLQLSDVTTTFVDPIKLVFPNAGKRNAGKLKYYTATCHYFDPDTEIFKTDGVSTKEYKEGDNDLICYLYHLTNFAVLLSPNELEQDETLEALTYVLLAISIICLIITLVVLMCLREIANTQRVQILKHFIFALLVSQLLFVFTTNLVKNQTLCVIFAAILHYFWLATFTWMLVQGIQLYTKVRRLVGGNIKQLFYVLFAWGFPLPIAIIPLAASSPLYFERAKTICWIPNDLIWFFAVPVVLIFCVNLGVTVLVMKTFLTVKVNKDKSDAEKLKSSMRAVIVMVPVLGLTWAFGFFLLIDQNKLFQYLFVILNTTQGVSVFLFHLVMNEDVKSAVLRRRNKVAANAENTIFTKLPRNKSEHSGGTGTETSKAPFNSDSTTGM